MPTDADNTSHERVVGRPWPKGVSGNPGGRPKGYREVLEAERIGHVPARIAKLREIADKFAEIALAEGDPKAALVSCRALELYLDRTCGKPMQAVALNASGGALEITPHVLRLLTDPDARRLLLAASRSAGGAPGDPGGVREGDERGEVDPGTAP